MINVHLNGDIVRCPNMSEIQKRVAEIRDQHGICKYNYHENTCNAWLCRVRTNKCSGRCFLASTDECPGHKRQTDHGKKEKTYRIDNKVYRKISSGAHYMVKESKNKTIFITLTFPPFKKKKTDEKEFNKCFSRFMENLHNNYGVKYYIAVKEYGERTGRVHFHVLLSIKFTSFTVLNSAWCSAISNICQDSPNALQTDKGNVIIRKPGSALRYACKYFSKSRGSVSSNRIVFISMPLILKAEKVFNKSIEDILQGFKSIWIMQTSDYTTCFRITNSAEFDRFCTLYLYDLFKLSGNKTDFIGLPGSLNN